MAEQFLESITEPENPTERMLVDQTKATVSIGLIGIILSIWAYNRELFTNLGNFPEAIAFFLGLYLFLLAVVYSGSKRLMIHIKTIRSISELFYFFGTAFVFLAMILTGLFYFYKNWLLDIARTIDPMLRSSLGVGLSINLIFQAIIAIFIILTILDFLGSKKPRRLKIKERQKEPWETK